MLLLWRCFSFPLIPRSQRSPGVHAEQLARQQSDIPRRDDSQLTPQFCSIVPAPFLGESQILGPAQLAPPPANSRGSPSQMFTQASQLLAFCVDLIHGDRQPLSESGSSQPSVKMFRTFAEITDAPLRVNSNGSTGVTHGN